MENLVPDLYKWRNEVAMIHSNWGAKKLIAPKKAGLAPAVATMRDEVMTSIAEQHKNAEAQQIIWTLFGVERSYDEEVIKRILQEANTTYTAVQDKLRDLSLAIDALIDKWDTNKKQERYL